MDWKEFGRQLVDGKVKFLTGSTKSVQNLWKLDQQQLQRWRTPRKKIIRSCVDVEIRAPSVYDALLGAAQEVPV